RTWRVCFMERAPKKVAWRGCEGIAAGKEHRIRAEDWWILLVLICHFIIPGIIFWWVGLRPERAYASLLKDHGQTDTILYLGLNHEQARDIAQTLHEVSGIPLQMNL